MIKTQPLVSVVTPIYNGEKYLRECIESVLVQTYQNWEYILVNNCSTDKTPQIAEEYSKKDKRIRVVHNSELLPIMKNWNHSLRQISSHSKYCKVIHADDWLFPECITKMVELGEKHDSIGVIGAYTLWNNQVACDGLFYSNTFLPGSEICRLTLTKQTYPFLSPSCLLIRSDLIRNRNQFYSEPNLHADVKVCYELLQHCDFGFIHQVLTFVRKHKESVTSTNTKALNKLILQNLDLMINYGPLYLSDTEFNYQLEISLKKYYRFLAKSLLHKRNKEFWEYHKNGLEKIGYPLSNLKLRIIWLIMLTNLAAKRFENKIKFTSN